MKVLAGSKWTTRESELNFDAPGSLNALKLRVALRG